MSAIATPYLPINRAAINAANAQFSTGPTSTEGKERIRFNALKTGIYARTVVLPGEDHAAYEALGAGVIETYQPVTANERELVLAIQNATWRMSRAVELEFSLFAIGAQQQLESIDAQFPGQPDHARYALARGAAYMLHSRTFDQLSRQEARYQRVLDRAVKDLRALIAQRPQNGPDPIPPPAVAAAPASGPTPVPPPVRPFVSPLRCAFGSLNWLCSVKISRRHAAFRRKAARRAPPPLAPRKWVQRSELNRLQRSTPQPSDTRTAPARPSLLRPLPVFYTL